MILKYLNQEQLQISKQQKGQNEQNEQQSNKLHNKVETGHGERNGSQTNGLLSCKCICRVKSL